MVFDGKKRFLASASVLIGTCIGAGVLGIPYVASKIGFIPSIIYILFIGGIILLINLYLGEIALRTKGFHQIAGYAKKYLGKRTWLIMEFATFFGIYSAIVAYILGVGDSLSFLFFNNLGYGIIFGVFFALVMSFFLWGGIKSLKKYEKLGVAIILILLLGIVVIFSGEVRYENLIYSDLSNFFLPFGVILFSLMSFHAISEVRIILNKREKMMGRVLIFGTIVSIIFYILFAMVVVGAYGSETPQIATLALGKIFVFLGIITMFTSYLALGNALQENLIYDDRLSQERAWFISSIVPIFIFLFTQLFFNYFSFTKILSMGGVVSGGLIAIMVLQMVRKAKKEGDRKPEYSIPVNLVIIFLLTLLFLSGIIMEIF